MDDKDVIIGQLQQENVQLRQENAELRALVLQLRDEIARLKNQNSSNSSKAPSSDIVNPQPRPRRKKRRRGGQSGHRRFQRQLFPPEQVDETILHELPEEDVRRGKLVPLDEYELTLQQIDLPAKLIHVVDHYVRLYRTPTGRVVRAHVPESVRKAGLFWTVVATCARQGRSVYQFILNALQATLDPNLPYPSIIAANP
jgi:hypothetical protein